MDFWQAHQQHKGLFLKPDTLQKLVVVVVVVVVGHFEDDFYRPNDQTTSVKELKKTRTTPPCYNNITLGNRFYAWREGPNVKNTICWTCKNCDNKCAADCEHGVVT